MTLKEIIDVSCGRDDMGRPNAVLEVLQYDQIPSSDNEPGITQLNTYVKPELDLSVYANNDKYYLKADIIFTSPYELELSSFWNVICDFNKRMTQAIVEEKDIPTISIIAMPTEFMNDVPVFFEMSLPIFTVLSSQDTGKMPNIISLLFDIDTCFIHENEDINIKEIHDEVNKEYEYLREKERREDERSESNNTDNSMGESQIMSDRNIDDNQVIRVGRNGISTDNSRRVIGRNND